MNLAIPPFIKENLRGIMVGGVLLLAALAYFLFFASSAEGGQAAGPGQGGPPPAIVTLAKVEKTAITPNFTAPGDVVANRDSVVAAEVARRNQSTLPIEARMSKGNVIAVY